MVLGGQPPGRVGRRRINFEEPASGGLFLVSAEMQAFGRLANRVQLVQWLFTTPPAASRASPGRARAVAAPARRPADASNSAASPSSANGLIVYNGSVDGLDSNGKSSSVCSRRISASASP